METISSTRPMSSEDYIAIWKRRRWWFLGTSALIAALVCIGVGLWPRSYRSEALIMITQPVVSQEAAKPMVAIDTDQEISGLVQQVMSRAILGRLDILRGNGPLSEKDFEDFRDAVTITTLKDNSDARRPAGKPFGLKVSFLAKSPAQAQKVTNMVAELVVQQADRMTLEQATETTAALRSQAELALTKVKEKGDALTSFKKQYAGQLPIDEQLTVGTLSRLQAELEVNGQEIERDRQSIANIETTSPVEKTEKSSASPNVSLSRLETDLQTAKDSLSELESRYKPTHPDVIKMQDEIKRLEAQITAQTAKSAAENTIKTPKASAAASPALAAHDRENRARLAARIQERKQLEMSIAQNQANLSAIPSRAQQFSELQREYDAAEKDYETIRDKLTDAEHSTDIYQQQKGARFLIQDYATLPDSAETPVRWKLNLGGLGGALMLGLVLAGLMELRDTSLKSDLDAEYYLGLKNMALIPDFPTTPEIKRARGKRYVWINATVLVALVLAGLNYYLYFGRL